MAQSVKSSTGTWALARVLWLGGGGGRGEVTPQSFWWGCSLNFETCTLFQTKICEIPYPISDFSEKLIPHFRPLK